MAKQKDTKVITNPVRMGYVNLLTPRAQEDGGDPRYSVQLLIPKTDKETLKAMTAAIHDAFESSKSDKLKGVKEDRVNTTLHDGDEEGDLEKHPELAGMMYMNVSSKGKPGLVDAMRNEITDPELVYSGMWGRVSINFYAYNSHGKKGISAGLNNVQKTKDDDFLGGRSRAEDDFDDWEDDDAEDDGLLD